jgi:hypothetical protein
MTVFHGLFRSQKGEPYEAKAQALSRLVSGAGHGALSKFLGDLFGNEAFKGSTVQKAQLAIELLRDELSEDSWRFIRDKFRGLAYLTDRRHTEEYAFDLVMGWVQEEVIIRALEDGGRGDLTCTRIGVDASREFSLRPRADADFIVHLNKASYKIDLFCDTKGHWKKTGVMDLKKGKVKHLLSGSLHAVLGLDLEAGTFHWIDRPMVVGRTTTTLNSSMGNNPVVQVQCPSPLSLAEVIRKLRVPTE